MAARSPEEHLVRARRRMAAAELMFRKGFVEDGANRLYYALYEAACAAPKTKGRRIPGKHPQILKLFNEVFSGRGPEWKVAIDALADLVGDRFDADYHEFDEDTYDVNGRIEQAEKFIETIRAVINLSNAPSQTDTNDDYEP